MQTQIKLSALAVALTAGMAATSASAINVDNAELGLTTGDGSGELFFSLWDTGRSQSFLLDLNLPVSQFVTNESSVVGFAVTSSELASFIAGGDTANMIWNVAGVSNVPNAAEFYTVSSIDLDSPYVAPSSPNIQGAVASAGQYIGAANPELSAGSAGDFGIFGVDGGLAYFGGGAWGFGWGGNYAFDNAPEVGEAGGTWLSAVDGTSTEFTAATWQLDPTTGTVSYVPVPAAVWLFGSALGLLGAVRRKMARTA